ncbi:helix-turn-helix domain-containing protein [Hymenobacter jejuensis]|uniref:Helix-turn-helix domain-containing protein n=1 Tax=Hymenobacter jejuensis TaxID=2502781 RepID=A0A5B8A0P2_9BACT|nr:helix-turn-helix domain-containing protein [Hymenobacter jejuensis]
MQMVIVTTPDQLEAVVLDKLWPRILFELNKRAEAPASTADTETLLTIREAAKLLDVCQQTVHDWKRRGVLPYHKMGGRTYLKRADLLNALKAHQRTEKPARKSAQAPSHVGR